MQTSTRLKDRVVAVEADNQAAYEQLSMLVVTNETLGERVAVLEDERTAQNARLEELHASNATQSKQLADALGRLDSLESKWAAFTSTLPRPVLPPSRSPSLP